LKRGVFLSEALGGGRRPVSVRRKKEKRKWQNGPAREKREGARMGGGKREKKWGDISYLLGRKITLRKKGGVIIALLKREKPRSARVDSVKKGGGEEIGNVRRGKKKQTVGILVLGGGGGHTTGGEKSWNS